MGITIRQGEYGLEVSYVHPGTPAEDADLRVGDQILMVDGHDTSGMSSMEFIPFGVGPEGSTVGLEIERDGQQLRKSFRRERIVKLDEDE
jgi:C-terminal processing protease CtpA/Prc